MVKGYQICDIVESSAVYVYRVLDLKASGLGRVTYLVSSNSALEDSGALEFTRVLACDSSLTGWKLSRILQAEGEQASANWVC